MNFTDSTTDIRVGNKPAERKANEMGQTPGASELDKTAMDAAQKAEERIHHNEETNSSNTTFSK